MKQLFIQTCKNSFILVEYLYYINFFSECSSEETTSDKSDVNSKDDNDTNIETEKDSADTNDVIEEDMNIDKNVEEVKDTVDSNDAIEVAMNIDKNVEEVKDTLDTNDVIDGDVNIDKSSKLKEKIDQTDSKVAMSQNSKIDLLKTCTIVDLFQEMGFVKQDCPEIERDIPNGSLTLLGENHKITKWCESKAHIKPGRTTENKYKVCKITGNKRVKYRYNDGAYEVHAHAFGWDKAKEHDLRNLHCLIQKYFYYYFQ